MHLVNLVRKSVSKRNSSAVILALVGGAVVIGLYNSAFFPEPVTVVEEVTRIKEMVLDTMTVEKETAIAFNRDQILNDYQNKVAEDFKIPEGLRDRVGFWFDIYTKYDSNNRVIHHTEYPWIVFKVIDVSSIINSDTPKWRWMRNQKADDLVKAEARKIRKALASLAKKKDGAVLTEDEQLVASALESLPGKMKKKAANAAGEVRVQVGQKNFFQEGLEVSPLYLSGMEEIFKSHNVPVELTRIPFVESSFNKHAVSKVGASGIWQFMGNTGKSFMVVDSHIDERHSPFKATDAAARLLKENHMILYRSWPLAVTAWNHGPPGMKKAVKSVGSKDLSKIVGKYRTKNFDFASPNFYCEFLAALHAERYQQDIFQGLNFEKSLEAHSVKLARTISAKELLRASGLSSDDFVMYNPDLKNALVSNASIPSGFKLMVNDSAKAVLKNLLSQERKSSKSKLGRNEVSSNNADTSPRL